MEENEIYDDFYSEDYYLGEDVYIKHDGEIYCDED